MDEPVTFKIGDWTLRQQTPASAGPFPVVLLLHGWTGDENAMWIFAERLPRNAVLIAPRAPYETPLGGYSWHPYQPKVWPWVDDFRPALQGLQELLTPQNFPVADFSDMRVVGFSQGAALAYAFALLHPQRLRAFAGLSGFAPDGALPLTAGEPLKDKLVFLAHGTKDELVPVERARQSAQLLQQAGAIVTYCEDEVGHKLSASCFRSLQIFFEKT